MTGLIAFLLINVYLGLPGSLLPHYLIFNLLVSAAFGLPIGYLISMSGGGALLRALYSTGALMAARIILGIPSLIGGTSFSTVAASSLELGLLGVFPGLLIGIHVSIDD